MINRKRQARQDRVINALIGPKDESERKYLTDFGVKVNNPEATTKRILAGSRWVSGTAIYELSALKINHQTGEMDDPRTCLTTGISNHPHIAGDDNGYKASMPSGTPIPDECVACVMSALLILSGGIKEVPVKAEFL